MKMNFVLGTIYNQIDDSVRDVDVTLEEDLDPQLYIDIPIQLTALGDPKPLVEKVTMCVWVTKEAADNLEKAVQEIRRRLQKEK